MKGGLKVLGGIGGAVLAGALYWVFQPVSPLVRPAAFHDEPPVVFHDDDGSGQHQGAQEVAPPSATEAPPSPLPPLEPIPATHTDRVWHGTLTVEQRCENRESYPVTLVFTAQAEFELVNALLIPSLMVPEGLEVFPGSAEAKAQLQAAASLIPSNVEGLLDLGDTFLPADHRGAVRFYGLKSGSLTYQVSGGGQSAYETTRLEGRGTVGLNPSNASVTILGFPEGFHAPSYQFDFGVTGLSYVWSQTDENGTERHETDENFDLHYKGQWDPRSKSITGHQTWVDSDQYEWVWGGQEMPGVVGGMWCETGTVSANWSLRLHESVKRVDPSTPLRVRSRAEVEGSKDDASGAPGPSTGSGSLDEGSRAKSRDLPGGLHP